MATKSILKIINIKTNSSARKLAAALEQSNQKSAESVVQSRAYHYASSKDIKKLFAQKDA